MNLLMQIFERGVYNTFVERNPRAEEWQCTLVMMLCIVFSAVIPYLLGSVNFAIVISKFRGEDIRDHGSKNAGATNMLRTYGRKAAVITLVGDFLKGYVSAIIGMLLFGLTGQYLASLFAVLGHVFPIYYNFKGGKGVATAAGTILGCSPTVLTLLTIIFVSMIAVTRYVSLASVTMALLYPFVLDRYYKLIPPFEGYKSHICILFVFLLSAVVFFKHIPNIKRLLNKTESKVSFGKKTKDEAETKEKPKSLHNDD